jgi:hypothetical protein
LAQRQRVANPYVAGSNAAGLVKGQPGIFLELTVDFLAHHRHLPLVKLMRAA